MAVNFVASSIPSWPGMVDGEWGGSKVSTLFQPSLKAAAQILSLNGYASGPGGEAAWIRLTKAIRAGNFALSSALKSTQSTLTYVATLEGLAKLVAEPLGVSTSSILALWAEHGKMYLDGGAPASPSGKLLDAANKKYAVWAKEKAFEAEDAAIQDEAARLLAEYKAKNAAAAAEKNQTDTPVHGTSVVKDSRGYSIAEFYRSSLEATYKVMASYPENRTQDKALKASLDAGAWQTVGNEDAKAALLAACLGPKVTVAQVKEGWAKQRDVWAKNQKPTVPSPYFTGIGVYKTSAFKSAAQAAIPASAIDDTPSTLAATIQSLLPWLALGAVGLGVVYFVSTAKKKAPIPALANPTRARRRKELEHTMR